MEQCRIATPADLPRIVELAQEYRAELGAMRGGGLWLERDAWREPLDEAYLRLIERSDAHLVVALIDDAMMGYGAAALERLRSGATLAVVTDLYVEPGARSVGLGELMIQELVAFCMPRATAGIDSVVLPGHRAAKAFFEAHGFLTRSMRVHRPPSATPPA